MDVTGQQTKQAWESVCVPGMWKNWTAEQVVIQEQHLSALLMIVVKKT